MVVWCGVVSRSAVQCSAPRELVAALPNRLKNGAAVFVGGLRPPRETTPGRRETGANATCTTLKGTGELCKYLGTCFRYLVSAPHRLLTKHHYKESPRSAHRAESHACHPRAYHSSPACQETLVIVVPVVVRAIGWPACQPIDSKWQLTGGQNI